MPGMPSLARGLVENWVNSLQGVFPRALFRGLRVGEDVECESFCLEFAWGQMLPLVSLVRCCYSLKSPSDNSKGRKVPKYPQPNWVNLNNKQLYTPALVLKGIYVGFPLPEQVNTNWQHVCIHKENAVYL